MIIYSISTGLPYEAQKHPTNDGFLIPDTYTQEEPPFFSEDQYAVYEDSEWTVYDKEVIIEKQDPSPIFEDSVPDYVPNVMEIFRAQRDYKISLTDWRMLPDYERGDVEEWKQYRKELRELPGRIDRGEIPMPTIDNEFRLKKYEHWPKEPTPTNLFPEGF